MTGWGEGSVVGRRGWLSYMAWVTCGSSLFLVAVDTIQCCLLDLQSLCYGFHFRRTRSCLHFQLHLRAKGPRVALPEDQSGWRRTECTKG